MAKLFEIKEVEKEMDIAKLPSGNLCQLTHQEVAQNRVFFSDDFKKVIEALPVLEPEKIYHLSNDGVWSMHQLVFHIVSLIGKADMYATSWSISEDVIKSIFEGYKSGLLTSVNFLFDYRVKKYRPKAYFFAKSNFNTRVLSCHAKVTVLMNDKYAVWIVGSANYTRNNRIEVCVLGSDRNTAEFHKNWILHKMNEANAEL